METNRGAPTPPIAFAAGEVRDHLATVRVEVDDALRARLTATGARLADEPTIISEASRDWWPLAMTWALDNQVAGLAGVVVRPSSVDEVSPILRIRGADGKELPAAEAVKGGAS